jgi:hypothetical protein
MDVSRATISGIVMTKVFIQYWHLDMVVKNMILLGMDILPMHQGILPRQEKMMP